MSEKLPGVIWVHPWVRGGVGSYFTKQTHGCPPYVPRKDLETLKWSLEEADRHAENLETENTALKAEVERLKSELEELQHNTDDLLDVQNRARLQSGDTS